MLLKALLKGVVGLQELQLSDEQTAQLLRMRKNGLAQLRAVLVERQSLNMKVAEATPEHQLETPVVKVHATMLPAPGV